jgi:hypothetical protein
MTRKLVTLLWTLAIVLAVLIAASPCAVAQTATQTITGCLQKGLESGGFYLTTSDNHHWELYQNSQVPLADHVGQTVTLTGVVPHRSTAQEQVSQPYEKKEMATMTHADFQVAQLKVVSATCGK